MDESQIDCSEQTQKSRPQREVIAEILDSRVPKSEREYVAAGIITRLADALKDCADDLEMAVEAEYAPLRGYPAYEKKRLRDLGPVREARDLLEILRPVY